MLFHCRAFSKLKISTCPLEAAQSEAVRFSIRWSAFASKSILTISIWLFLAAHIRAVFPVSRVLFTSAPYLMRTSAMAVRPLMLWRVPGCRWCWTSGRWSSDKNLLALSTWKTEIGLTIGTHRVIGLIPDEAPVNDYWFANLALINCSVIRLIRPNYTNSRIETAAVNKSYIEQRQTRLKLY